MKARYFPGETISYISLANIAARAALWHGTMPGMHAYFSAKAEGRNSVARLAQMRRFITYDDDARAREAWSRNDQVHLFFVLVNVSSRFPLIPRRSSFTGTSRCISLVQLFSLYS